MRRLILALVVGALAVTVGAVGVDQTYYLVGGPGGGGAVVRIGGVISSNVTAVANSGAIETDLMTYTLPGGSLATHAQGLRITATWTTAANATAKDAKWYFGGTVIGSLIGDTGVSAQIRMTGYVFRTGAATQFGSVLTDEHVGATLGNGNAQVTAPAETLSGAVVIKTTGKGGVNADITCVQLLVEVLP